MSEIKRILVIRTDRIGDLVLTLPMADILRMNYPDAHIAMMTRRYTAELAGNSESVNEVILYDTETGLVPFFEMLSFIRRQNFDVAFVAFPRMRIALILWLAGIKFRVGSGFRLYSIFFNRRIFEHRKNAKKHELEHNLIMLEKFGCTLKKIAPPWIKVPDENILTVKNKLKNLNVNENDKLVVIHPGSGGSSRDWSLEKFSQLGKLITTLPNTKVIITGGKNEKQLAHHLQSSIGHGSVDLGGELSLLDYAALSKLAKLFIGNSTGPLHIAAAVGTAVIGFFSHLKPMTPDRWGPYTDKKKVFTPQNKPAHCKKCVKNTKKCECMDTISDEEVFNAVVQFVK